MEIKQFIIVLLVQLYNVSGAAPPIPLKCWLWDSPCLTAKAQAISLILVAGIPELDMQPLDPIVIDYIHIDEGKFKVEFRSMIVKGMGDAIVDSIRVDMSTKTANFVFHTDFDTKSRYINNGTLLSSSIHGDGDFSLKLAPPIPLKCWLWDSPCLIVKAQAISPILVAGVPELDMQPLDPIVIDYIHIDEGGYKVDIRSMIVKGMSNAVVDSISVDMSKKRANFVFHTDFNTKSLYINNGTLLSSPIHGDGDFFIKLENVQITMNVHFDIINDLHGKDVMNLKSYSYAFDVKSGAEFRFENLYNGDKKSSDNMHTKFNQNWKFLMITYGHNLFDPLAEKLFYSMRNYVRSEAIETVALYALK